MSSASTQVVGAPGKPSSPGRWKSLAPIATRSGPRRRPRPGARPSAGPTSRSARPRRYGGRSVSGWSQAQSPPSGWLIEISPPSRGGVAHPGVGRAAGSRPSRRRRTRWRGPVRGHLLAGQQRRCRVRRRGQGWWLMVLWSVTARKSSPPALGQLGQFGDGQRAVAVHGVGVEVAREPAEAVDGGQAAAWRPIAVRRLPVTGRAGARRSRCGSPACSRGPAAAPGAAAATPATSPAPAHRAGSRGSPTRR